MSRKQRSNDDLVVGGTAADGHGVMTGFRGDGPMVRTRLLELAQRAGIPETWFPTAKDAKVQLTRAMKKTAGDRGLAVEQEKRRNRQVEEAREPSSRWMLVSGGADGAPRAGAAYGRVALVATLYDDANGQSLAFEPEDDPLAIAVRIEYDRLIGAEQFQASDVTGWLNEVHRGHLNGVRYGAGWYIPRAHRAIAEAIVEVFWTEARWGEAWMDPPLPVATSTQLALGLAHGLCAEVDEQMALLDGQRRRLRETKAGHNAKGISTTGGVHDEHGDVVDIGQRAAESFMIRLARVRSRVDAYQPLLGLENHTSCHRQIDDAMIELDACLEGGATTVDGKFRDLESEDDARHDSETKAKNETSFAGVS